MTLEQVFHYEAKSCNLVMSFIYRILPADYYIWVCRRKFKRYNDFNEMMQKKVFNHFQKAAKKL